MGARIAMDSLISRLFIHEWQRKCVAVVIAVFVWLLVNQSIIATKTIPSVPIRLINLPVGKSIEELLPNGFLNKRVTLNLSGSKEVVENLEPGDFEVLLDATDKPEEWIVHITKKNLISLNPEIDLAHHITQVSHPELILKFTHHDPDVKKSETELK